MRKRNIFTSFVLKRNLLVSIWVGVVFHSGLSRLDSPGWAKDEWWCNFGKRELRLGSSWSLPISCVILWHPSSPGNFPGSGRHNGVQSFLATAREIQRYFSGVKDRRSTWECCIPHHCMNTHFLKLPKYEFEFSRQNGYFQSVFINLIFWTEYSHLTRCGILRSIDWPWMELISIHCCIDLPFGWLGPHLRNGAASFPDSVEVWKAAMLSLVPPIKLLLLHFPDSRTTSFNSSNSDLLAGRNNFPPSALQVSQASWKFKASSTKVSFVVK